MFSKIARLWRNIISEQIVILRHIFKEQTFVCGATILHYGPHYRPTQWLR